MIHSFKVATTLAAWRGVVMSAAETVAYPSADTLLPIGVTIDTVLDTVNSIPVAGPGEIARLYLNDSIAAAALIGLDSSGRGVPYAQSNTTTGLTLQSGYIGLNVGAAATGAGITGTINRVYVMPGFDR